MAAAVQGFVQLADLDHGLQGFGLIKGRMLESLNCNLCIKTMFYFYKVQGIVPVVFFKRTASAGNEPLPGMANEIRGHVSEFVLFSSKPLNQPRHSNERTPVFPLLRRGLGGVLFGVVAPFMGRFSKPLDESSNYKSKTTTYAKRLLARRPVSRLARCHRAHRIPDMPFGHSSP